MRYVLLAFTLLDPVARAQQPPRPEFEVASVKPSSLDPSQVGRLSMAGGVRMGAQIQGNKADYLHMTMRQLVSEAWRLQPFQIVCPAWFLEDRFDIEARMPAGAAPAGARLMLQSLLESRFKLAVHRESREEPVAALVVGPSGPKLTPSSPAGSPGQPKRPAPPGSQNAPFGAMMGNVAVTFTINQAASTVRFDARRMTMPDLARFLMNFGAGGGRPVVDLTGLDGEYDVALEIPLSMFGGNASAEDGAPARPADAASDPGAPTVLRSLRTYGLDLKNTRAPVDRLVVDHAERKPVEN